MYTSIVDSLCYEIVTDDIYKDMMNIQDYFDTSNYDEDHPLYSTKHKKYQAYLKMKWQVSMNVNRVSDYSHINMYYHILC